MTAGSASGRVLVATDNLSDGELVRKLLSDEFDNVILSTQPERAVADFESRKPDVLVLAFDELEKAERYYLGLYRLGATVHTQPHRTVILCDRDDLRRVYELCKREYFDDYILFWPMTHDVCRLPMAIHQALRQLSAARQGTGAPAEIAAQARRIAELEAALAQFAARGAQRVEAVRSELRRAGTEIGAALDGFSQRLGGSAAITVRDRRGFEAEFDRLKSEHIAPSLRAAAETVEPVSQWLGSLHADLGPQIDSARELRALVDRLRPLVLVVEDDELQRRALGLALTEAPVDLAFASSGAEALGTLRRRRPDLVLMDIDLPDIDGIEATRRLKSVDQFAAVPVVMITGHSEKHLVVDSLKAGAADFVVKPFEKTVLLAKVRRFLG